MTLYDGENTFYRVEPRGVWWNKKKMDVVFLCKPTYDDGVMECNIIQEHDGSWLNGKGAERV